LRLNPKLWLTLTVLLAGCQGHRDPRQAALQQGMDQIHALLLNPSLRALADKQKGNHGQQLVEALFSDESRPLWPPREVEETTYKVGNHTLPGRIAYLKEPDAPWSVVVRPSEQGDSVWLEGYAVNLKKPLLHENVIR
jgi:hypothetical protein